MCIRDSPYRERFATFFYEERQRNPRRRVNVQASEHEGYRLYVLRDEGVVLLIGRLKEGQDMAEHGHFQDNNLDCVAPKELQGNVGRGKSGSRDQLPVKAGDIVTP